MTFATIFSLLGYRTHKLMDLSLLIEIYLLLIILIIYVYVIITNKNIPIFKEGIDNKSFLKLLDKYYIKKMPFTSTIVFYFIFTTIIFIIYDIVFLGCSTNIYMLTDFSFSTFFFSKLLLFILTIKLYLNTLYIIFYSYIIQVHFYLIRFKLYSNLSFRHVSRFFCHLHYSVLFIILIYDLSLGALFYTNYALLFFLLITFVKKTRFLDKHWTYDNEIYCYFYKNDKSYTEIRSLILNDTCTAIAISQQTYSLLTYKDEIIDYFNHNLKVDPIQAHNEIYLTSIGFRTNILALLILGNIYYIYNYEKYSIIYYNMKIQPIFFLAPLLILSIFIQSKNLTIIKGNWKRNNKINLLFYSIVLLQIIPILYIMLKNRITLFPDEIILNISYLQISEEFTFSELKLYLEHYLDYLLQTNTIDIKICKIVKYDIQINPKDSILELHKKIAETIVNYYKTERRKQDDLFIFAAMYILLYLQDIL